MNGLFSFFLKLLLEKLTQLIVKNLALDIDGKEYFYAEQINNIGKADAFAKSRSQVNLFICLTIIQFFKVMIPL